MENEIVDELAKNIKLNLQKSLKILINKTKKIGKIMFSTYL